MSDEREARLEKLAALRAAHIEPYPTKSGRDTMAADALARYDELQGQQITLAGRLMALREMGKSVFAHIEDGSGRIQIYIKRDAVGDEAFQQLKLLDLGDFVEASGTLFTTRTGEKSLHVDHYRLLAKSLLPLPAKGAGGELKLFDTETRYRKRYMDLIANREEEFTIFLARSKAIQAIRDFLNARGYIEVETPVLQPLYGGATARPFVTHHNTLDRDLYLRIALELYLKRLIVGGFERVYEIGRNFRNEGIDRSHNPEFTMLECYEAYSDYVGMMELTEQMVAAATLAARGTLQIDYQGTVVDLTPPWKRVTLREMIAQYLGIDYEEYPTREALLAVIRERKLPHDPQRGRGRLIDGLMDEVFKRNTEDLKQPMFLCDYPKDMLPLAKDKPGSADTVEAFQAFAGGLQLAKAFTELNNPVEQRSRFNDQAMQRERGDDEAQVFDEDFVEALEVGMPPTGGMGMGIDRLIMLLTDQTSIREVILFPTQREK